MGSRGPLRNAQEQGAGHRDHSLAVLPQGGRITATPRAPADLDAKHRRAWRTYWESPVARVAIAVDLPAIRRLFELYQQRDEALKALKAGLLVRGSVSKQQLRPNPAVEILTKLEGLILRLENEIGATPMARARLGIALERFMEDALAEHEDVAILDRYRDLADSG